MPLDPKKQPPYYSPGTAGIIDNKYVRLNTQYNAVATSGTTETDLYLYTIPANTLTENGDTLQIKFGTIKSGTTGTAVVRFYLDGTIQFGTFTELQYLTWNIQIIRNSSTTAQIIMELTAESGQDAAIFQTATTLDFTTTIPLKFTGECQAGDTEQTYQMTIDKITI